jgi:hypothetical protein
MLSSLLNHTTSKANLLRRIIHVIMFNLLRLSLVSQFRIRGWVFLASASKWRSVIDVKSGSVNWTRDRGILGIWYAAGWLQETCCRCNKSANRKLEPLTDRA